MSLEGECNGLAVNFDNTNVLNDHNYIQMLLPDLLPKMKFVSFREFSSLSESV